MNSQTPSHHDAPSPQAAPATLEPGNGGRLLWGNVLFLLFLHVGGLAAVASYVIWYDVGMSLIALCIGGVLLTTFGISAGYHRLFSHRSYQTGPVFSWLVLGLGASAFQNSALEWSTNHRQHHRFTDRFDDPYNATRGFWYSHVGWVLREGRSPVSVVVDDLQTDPMIRAQHRWYVPLALGTGFVLPAAVGWWMGDVWGGLLFGGVLRLLICYHVTFAINSLAHCLGARPYDTTTTARDSWLTALFTMGEGYHNFHHSFPGDYRNGHRFFDFDPPKWVLAGLSRLGVVRNLKRTPGHLIALRMLRADKSRRGQLRLSAARRQKLDEAVATLQGSLRNWSRAAQRARPSLEHSRRSTGPTATEGTGLLRKAFWRQYRDYRSLLREGSVL